MIIERKKKKPTLFALLLAALSMLSHGCVKEGPPIVGLGTPQFVPQSPPDSAAESGIGQDPNSGGIFLQWFGSYGAYGYDVYRSDTTDASGSPVTFLLVNKVSSAYGLEDTSTVDLTALTGVTYYYYVRAVASDGTLSTPSDTVNYRLLQRPILVVPVNNLTVSHYTAYFQWVDLAGGGYTVLRVKDISSVPPTYTWISKAYKLEGGYNPTWNYDFDSTAVQPLISGNSYEWQIDRFNSNREGRPYEGARSIWGTFSTN